MPEPSAPTPSPTPSRMSAVSPNESACTSSVVSMCPRIAGSAISLPSRSSKTAASEPDEAAEQALEHERAAHEPVRRADELHHLDLAAAGEDREPDRVRDQEHRRDQQHDHRDEEDDPDPRADLEDALRGLLAVLHPLDAGELLAAQIGGDRLHVLGVPRRDLVRGGSGFDGRFAVSRGTSSPSASAPRPSRRTGTP